MHNRNSLQSPIKIVVLAILEMRYREKYSFSYRHINIYEGALKYIMHNYIMWYVHDILEYTDCNA